MAEFKVEKGQKVGEITSAIDSGDCGYTGYKVDKFVNGTKSLILTKQFKNGNTFKKECVVDDNGTYFAHGNKNKLDFVN